MTMILEITAIVLALPGAVLATIQLVAWLRKRE